MVVHTRWWSEVIYTKRITLVSKPDFLKCLRMSIIMVNAIVISATGESPRGMVPMVPVMMRLFILQKWITSFLLLWLISPDPWALIIPTQLRFGSPHIAFMSLLIINMSCFLKPHTNGHIIVGCYMLCPLAHPVACCWQFLHLFAHHCNTDATKCNVIGTTMLGVAVSVCT